MDAPTPNSKEEEPKQIVTTETPKKDDVTVELVEELEKLTIQNAPVATKSTFIETYDLKGLAKFIKDGNCRKILVMSGAGISTAAGIPDFRSPKTGLYHQLEKYNLPYAEAIFSIDYFEKNPKPFCILAREMYPSNFQPTPCHYFVKLLDDKGLLLRNYTQNIDTLERGTGINQEKLVEAHGSFGDASCIKCDAKYSADFVKEIVFKDEIPKCSKCKGLVKPNITFFGEDLPARYDNCLKMDKNNADLLIVLGTSLSVYPFASIVEKVPQSIPRILINMDSVGVFKKIKAKRDMQFLGDCQTSVLELVHELGWTEDFEKLIPIGNLSFQKARKDIETKYKEKMVNKECVTQ